MDELKIENVKNGICKVTQTQPEFASKPSDMIVFDIRDWKRMGKVMGWEQ